MWAISSGRTSCAAQKAKQQQRRRSENILLFSHHSSSACKGQSLHMASLIIYLGSFKLVGSKKKIWCRKNWCWEINWGFVLSAAAESWWGLRDLFYFIQHNYRWNNVPSAFTLIIGNSEKNTASDILLWEPETSWLTGLVTGNRNYILQMRFLPGFTYH